MKKDDKTLESKQETQAPCRGRPRAFCREDALNKATCLFWNKGYEATSISDLKQAIGINAPSLYATFGSKEELFTEVLQHYVKSHEHLVWGNFFKADTARGAVEALLLDSAFVLTGGHSDTMPRGCMVTLSAVGNEGHPELGKLVQFAREGSVKRLEERLSQGISKGEMPKNTDIHTLARFIQTVQNGMSLLARDGVPHEELKNVAELAMLAFDAKVS